MLRELGRLDEVELIASTQRGISTMAGGVACRAHANPPRAGDIEGSSAMLRALLAQGFARLDA